MLLTAHIQEPGYHSCLANDMIRQAMISRIVLWASIFSLSQLGLRSLLFIQSPHFDTLHLYGIIIDFFGQFLLALLPALLLFSRKFHYPLISWFFVIILSLINTMSAHYEVVFGRLPSSSLLYYLDQIPVLSASIFSNVPIGALLLEVVLSILPLVAATIILYRKSYSINRLLITSVLIVAPLVPGKSNRPRSLRVCRSPRM